jgi:glycosyltransferase involved in cell wall biosynthesis
MRILLLHSSSDIYGASKIFLQTVKLLKEKGHYTVVALSATGPLSIALENIGVEVYIINLAILRRKYFSISGILNRYQKWGAAVKALDAFINQHQIDTLYSNTAAVLVGGYIAKKKKLQHIWHLHEIIEKPVFLHAFLASRLRNWADKIIVVSKAVEAHWKDSVTQNKMFQVYNGLPAISSKDTLNTTNNDAPSSTSSDTLNTNNNDTPNISSNPAHSLRTKLSIPTEAIVIGMAARIHFWKGQTYFIDIAQTLLQNAKQQTPTPAAPLYFIIAGDPFPGYEHLQVEMEKAIVDNQLSDRVFYVGLVNDMARFYQSINVLVLPSQQPDPLPTVVLEAMQYALPVVATAQGGVLEMVIGELTEAEKVLSNNLHDATGLFIPLNDALLAANKIESILTPRKLQALGEAGKKRVEQYFSAASFEKNMISVFEISIPKT